MFPTCDSRVGWCFVGLFAGLALLTTETSGQTNRSGNPLQIPPVWSGGTLTAAATNRTLWPGFSTGLLAINGSVPSPTIRVQRGSNFTARIQNQLTNNLVIHWHGIVAPPEMDGHPRNAVAPGQSYDVNFPIRQRAGTYFYHPHTEPLTGQLVYQGLAGALIVEDPAEAALGLPGGEHDVPLLIQDKRLREDRQLVYDPSMMDFMTGFLGDTVLVNATPEAYLSVDRSLYRFRLINGSNARVYKLGFSDGRAFQIIATDGGLLGAPLAVTSAFLAPGERIEIVTDFSTNQVGDSVVLQSLEFSPATMSAMATTNAMMNGTEDMSSMMGTNMDMMMAPGSAMGGMIYTNGMFAEGCNAMMTIMMSASMTEATSMSMDGTNTMEMTQMGDMTAGPTSSSTSTNHMGMMDPAAGTGTTDSSNMATNGMGSTNMTVAQGMAMDVLRFFVDREGAMAHTLPAKLADLTAEDPAQSRRTRTFSLDMLEMAHGINGATYDLNRVDFQVPFGELETWEFINKTDEVHPMHVHGLSFQVLSRRGDTNLPPENRGWKDTVLVWPNETVRLLVRFKDYVGTFVSHCHNLEHEDTGMMQNFAVQPTSLGIARQGANLVFAYPAIASNWVVEATQRLGPTAQWTNLTGILSLNGDWVNFSIPPPPGNRFYRLRQAAPPPAGSSTGGDPHAGHH